MVLRRVVIAATSAVIAVTTLGGTPPAAADAAGWRFTIGNVSAPADGPRVVAGSTGNMLAFGFTSGGPGPTQVRVSIPAVSSGTGWTPPQTTNPGAPGYVRVGPGGCTSATLDGIFDSLFGVRTGGWTISATVDCPTNTQFGIFYGSASGGTKVTAPSVAGPQVFTASIATANAQSISNPTSTVTVLPGKPVGIRMTTRHGITVVGRQDVPKQSLVLEAVDALGNRVTSVSGPLTATYATNANVDASGMPTSFVLRNGVATALLRFPVSARYPYLAAQTKLTVRSANGALSGSTTVRIGRLRPSSTVLGAVAPNGAVTAGVVSVLPGTALVITSSTISPTGQQTFTAAPTGNTSAPSLSISTGTPVLPSAGSTVVASPWGVGTQIVISWCTPTMTITLSQSIPTQNCSNQPASPTVVAPSQSSMQQGLMALATIVTMEAATIPIPTASPSAAAAPSTSP